jgi:hypothetical protein
MFRNLDEFLAIIVKFADDLITIAGGKVVPFLAAGVIAVVCHAFLDSQWYRGKGGFFTNILSFLAFMTVCVSFGFAAYLYVFPYHAA